MSRCLFAKMIRQHRWPSGLLTVFQVQPGVARLSAILHVPDHMSVVAAPVEVGYGASHHGLVVDHIAEVAARVDLLADVVRRCHQRLLPLLTSLFLAGETWRAQQFKYSWSCPNQAGPNKLV